MHMIQFEHVCMCAGVQSVSLHQQVITPIMHWQAELNAAKV